MRQQVHAVLSRGVRTRGGGQRGEQIERNRRVFECRSLGQPRRPLEDEWHADTAVQVKAFEAVQRGVRASVVDVARASVVGEKDKQGVLFQPVLAKLCHDSANHVIERSDHGGVDALVRLFDMAVALKVFRRRLKWCVGRVGGQH